MYKNRFVLCLANWFIVFLCAFVTGIIALGMEPSDAEILKTAIAKYESNVGQIMTWQGKVIGELYEKGSPPTSDKVEFFGKPIKISEISFSDDIVTGNSLCIHRVLRNYNTEFHDEICTLFLDGVSYEISRYKDIKANMNRKLSYESTLAIRAVTRNDLSRLLSTHFIPLEKTDFIDLRLGALKRYYEIALKYPPSETSNITVRNVNNLLVIESYIKNINLRARYCFDMQCGAMPVEYLSIRNEQGVHWQSRLQNYSGVWIPEEIQMVYKLSDGTQEWCKYIWKENTINAKIPKEVFSINSLGVHRGTTVYDYRTGAESVLSDSKLPPMPNDNIENLKHFSMTRIVLIVLGIILILIAVIAKIVKKIKENR